MGIDQLGMAKEAGAVVSTLCILHVQGLLLGMVLLRPHGRQAEIGVWHGLIG